MRFARVEVNNVRNIVTATLTLAPTFNLITGPNGAGKTTLLECLHLLSRARSFRSGVLNSLISHDESHFLVAANCVQEERTFRVGIQKTRSTYIQLRVDGVNVRQVSQLTRLVPLQTFLPDAPDLVFGSPTLRRSWLNWSVFHSDSHFIELHRVFLRLLQQRNRAIQQRSNDLATWTAKFVEKAEAITALRKQHLLGLDEHFQRLMKKLNPDLNVSLQYLPGWSEDSLLESLNKDHNFQIKYRVTRLGPHRADVRIDVVDGNDGKRLGLASRILSRGQGKLVACALKLAQTEYVKQFGSASVLLLDDVATEFDEEFARRFYRTVAEMGTQVIATTAQDPESVLRSLKSTTNQKLFSIQQGRLTSY